MRYVGVVDSSVVCALQTDLTKAMELTAGPRDDRLTTRLRSAFAQRPARL